jgi:isocitrate/isopropylmalate dehydrogenase
MWPPFRRLTAPFLHDQPQEAGEDGIATDQMIYTVAEVERIVRLAANIARGRSKVVTR